MQNNPTVTLTLVLACAISLCVKSVTAQNDALTTLTESLKPNVVAIRASFGDGSEEKGFGFITAEQNGRLYLATAAHVVRGPYKDKSAQTIRVKFFNDISWYTATFKYHWDEEDLALLVVPKPSSVKWRAECADLQPGIQRKVHFIGLNGHEPSWADPGLDGNIYEQNDKHLNFAIGTIRPGTSGAPLITEKGIVGLITQDEGGISTALKLTQIKALFSGAGQYPYFSLKPLGRMVAPPPLVTSKPVTSPQSYKYSLVFVKGGSFTMGCTSEQGSDCWNSEKPAHKVTLNDFYIGKYEVTQAQWKAIMGRNPSYFSNCDQCPVERVSWNDVQQFLSKLNAKTGKKYRLPTEAEWEYAARGGNLSQGYKYAGSNTIDKVAWYFSIFGSTHPVGQKKANELGLYDMSGNVWEWCQDWYGDYSGTTQTAGSGSYRVFRGGSWNLRASFSRVSYRNYYTPTSRIFVLGFRLAL